MKKIAFVAFALTTFLTYSQSDKVIIGGIKKIDSKILNEKREICISLPKSYNSNSASNQKYPVIYLLDGENNFSSVAGMLTDWTGTSQSNYPEMIVVGIINIDRNKDYTPTIAYINSEDSLIDSSGGGEKFTSFIEKELIPYINENYSTDSYNVLIGHSLGGLFVVNTLLNHTQLFNAYIAIDPSLWWDNKILVKQAKEKLSLLNFEGISLYMGIANTIDGGYDTSNIQNSTIPSNYHPQAIFELDKLLKTKTKQLKYQSHYYENEDHTSVGFISKIDGLAHIFKLYKLKISDDEFENIDQEYIIKIENHFKSYSKSIGHDVKVPESFINEIGYSCLNLKKYDVAKLLFEYNIKNYPFSGNCYDSYGDYFVEIGNIDQAIIYFEKALTLSTIPEIKKKLKAFKKRK